MQVNSALYFCLDSQQNIIISDTGSDNIKAFTKEGILMHSIGGSGQAVGMFVSPRGIALNNELNLVVISCNCSYGLQIFSSFV